MGTIHGSEHLEAVARAEAEAKARAAVSIHDMRPAGPLRCAREVKRAADGFLTASCVDGPLSPFRRCQYCPDRPRD